MRFFASGFSSKEANFRHKYPKAILNMLPLIKLFLGFCLFLYSTYKMYNVDEVGWMLQSTRALWNGFFKDSSKDSCNFISFF
jgi:hypothetical protein